MDDEIELQLSEHELSELKRVSSRLGISPEEGALIALRDYIRRFEAEQKARLGDEEE